MQNICPEDFHRFELKNKSKKLIQNSVISSPPGYDAVTVEPKAQQKAAGASKEMGDVWDVEMFCCLNWIPKADFFLRPKSPYALTR